MAGPDRYLMFLASTTEGREMDKQTKDVSKKRAMRMVAVVVGLVLGCLCFALVILHETKKHKRMIMRTDDVSGIQEYYVSSRIKRIEDEWQDDSSSKPWEGRYSGWTGYGGSDLWLAPKAGFVLSRSSHEGPRETIIGDAREAGDAIILSSLGRIFDGPVVEFVARLVYVQWGERSYLIPPEQMIAFGNYARANRELKEEDHGEFLMRTRAVKKVSERGVLLPKEWEWTLDAPDIEGVVVEVLSNRTVDESAFGRPCSDVRMDLGVIRGAFPGMRLKLVEPTFDETVTGRIISVNKEDCLARIWGTAVPKVGWTFARWVRGW